MQRWKCRPEGANWGDFGSDDQLGRMNLITPEIRRAAAAEIREGIAFSLSLPLDYPGWPVGAMGREAPRRFATEHEGVPAFNFPFHHMVPGSTDYVCDDAVTLFTQYSTQWDSLAHWGRLFDLDGTGAPVACYYNGYRAGTDLVSGEAGRAPEARRLGIEHLAQHGAQGRGVLVDITGRGSVGWKGLRDAMADQSVRLREGDFLLSWTGYDDALLAMNKRPDPSRLHAVAASLDGSDPDLLSFIADSGIVAICSDHPAVETVPAGADACADGRTFLPLHELCLFKLGIHLGELWRLGDLARWLRAQRRSACFLTAPPLRLPGAVGSPLTPVATV